MSIKIQPTILQETTICKVITEATHFFFCNFETQNTNYYIIHCVAFCSKMFSNKYGCHDVMERGCKQHFLSGVQKPFSAFCKGMGSSFRGTICKINPANYSPKPRLCSSVLARFKSSLFEPATEINMCLHSKAVEPVVGKTKKQSHFVPNFSESLSENS